MFEFGVVRGSECMRLDWFAVVDTPTFAPHIVPSHTFGKLRFEMMHEIVQGIANKVFPMTARFFSTKRFPHSSRYRCRDAKRRIRKEVLTLILSKVFPMLVLPSLVVGRLLFLVRIVISAVIYALPGGYLFLVSLIVSVIMGGGLFFVGATPSSGSGFHLFFVGFVIDVVAG